jgi:hypothetical protein
MLFQGGLSALALAASRGLSDILSLLLTADDAPLSAKDEVSQSNVGRFLYNCGVISCTQALMIYVCMYFILYHRTE